MHLYWPRLLDGSRVNRQGGCCPWWSLWPSCDIGWCRCPRGQVVCFRWCVVQTSLPSGEPYSCGWSSCRTRQWYNPTGCSQFFLLLFITEGQACSCCKLLNLTAFIFKCIRQEKQHDSRTVCLESRHTKVFTFQSKNNRLHWVFFYHHLFIRNSQLLYL